MEGPAGVAYRGRTTPAIWRVPASAGPGAGQKGAGFQHISSAQSPGARVDATGGGAEKRERDIARGRAGLQYRRRGLFGGMDHTDRATGSEACAARGGYFKGSRGSRQRRQVLAERDRKSVV